MRLIDADLLKARIVESLEVGTLNTENDIMAIIDEESTVKEQKCGRWERVPGKKTAYWKCSNCDGGYINTKWDYCPLCGADMIGGYDG